jgi:hypothetical protein
MTGAGRDLDAPERRRLVISGRGYPKEGPAPDAASGGSQGTHAKPVRVCRATSSPRFCMTLCNVAARSIRPDLIVGFHATPGQSSEVICAPTTRNPCFLSSAANSVAVMSVMKISFRSACSGGEPTKTWHGGRVAPGTQGRRSAAPKRSCWLMAPRSRFCAAWCWAADQGDLGSHRHRTDAARRAALVRKPAPRECVPKSAG